MALLEEIQTQIVTAMKAKDQLRLDTLRAMKTAIIRYQTEPSNLNKPFDEKSEQSILGTLVKQRREAAEAFLAAGRVGSAGKEQDELAIIEEFMPKVATEAEMDFAINLAFENAVGKPNMGAMMELTKAYLTGKRVDGKALSGKVKARLT